MSANAEALPAATAPAAGTANPWLIAVVVALAVFMEVLDTTIANVALPYIAGGLGVSQDEASWVVTTYLVANAIIITATGFLPQRFGRKPFFLFSLGLFTLSSVLCGMAWNLQSLLLFRVLQGIGGGGMVPVAQSILADSFPPQKRGQAFALFGVAVVVAPVIGPTLGGWIADNYSWQWNFLINGPIGLGAMALVFVLVHEGAPANKDVRFDLIGFLLVATFLGSLEVVLDRGLVEDWFEFELHHNLLDYLRAGLCGADTVGGGAKKSYRRRSYDRHAPIRVRFCGDAVDWKHPLRDDPVHAPTCAGTVWLYGDLGGARPLAGRAIHHGHDVRRGPAFEPGAAQISHRGRRGHYSRLDVRFD